MAHCCTKYGKKLENCSLPAAWHLFVVLLLLRRLHTWPKGGGGSPLINWLIPTHPRPAFRGKVDFNHHHCTPAPGFLGVPPPLNLNHRPCIGGFLRESPGKKSLLDRLSEFEIIYGLQRAKLQPREWARSHVMPFSKYIHEHRVAFRGGGK